VRPSFQTILRRPLLARVVVAVALGAIAAASFAPAARAAGGSLSIASLPSVPAGTDVTVTATGVASQQESLYLFVESEIPDCPATASEASGPGYVGTLLDEGVAPGSVNGSATWIPPAGGSFLICGYLTASAAGTPDAQASARTVVAGSHTPTPPAPSPKPTVTKPAVKGSPSVSGEVVAGRTLHANTGRWGGTEPLDYAYRWQVCAKKCSPIPGATASSYVIPDRDAGAAFRVVVTASNAAGTGQATSAMTFWALQAICGRDPCLPDRPGGRPIYKTPLILLNRHATEAVGGIRLPNGRALSRANELRWRTWTPQRAVADGYFWKDSCVPSCARGTYAPYPAVVTASQPRNQVFTHLRIVYRTPNGDGSLTAAVTRSGGLTVRVVHTPKRTKPKPTKHAPEHSASCAGSFNNPGVSAPGETGFYRGIRAQDMSCLLARQITQGYVSAVSAGAPLDEMLIVDGFSCVTKELASRDNVACYDDNKTVTFFDGP
jgi:hypothetical protein